MFPMDDSTNFLEPVRIVLEKKLDATIIRGDTTKEEHRQEIMAQLCLWGMAQVIVCTDHLKAGSFSLSLGGMLYLFRIDLGVC